MSGNYGYIGNNPGSSSVVVARQSFSPSGLTTTFTFFSGYSVGYLDAYLNGARLIEGQDYIASNGSTVDIVGAATTGDVLELVAYKAFNTVVALTYAPGNFAVGGDLSVNGTTTLRSTSASNLAVTGITTLGSVSAGIVSATTYYGDGSQLTGIPVGELYELDSISPAGGENTYTPTFNYDTVSITDPFKLLISVNGVLQSAYVHNTEYVFNNYLLVSRTGYTIDYDGKIKFTESLPEGSDVIIKTTSGSTKSTTRKYPFNALDILF